MYSRLPPPPDTPATETDHKPNSVNSDNHVTNDNIQHEIQSDSKITPTEECEKASTNEGSDASSELSEAGSVRPQHVRKELWKKFLNLEKRTNDATRRSTERRISDIQKKVMKTVTNELTHPEDKDILREHDVKFGPPVVEDTGRKWRRRGKAAGEASTSTQSTSTQSTSNPEWTEVQSYLDVNDHLRGADPGHGPKSRLEENVNEAVKLGDYELAEALSDNLATREFGERITKAFDARDFIKRKKSEAETSKAKKKKKLHWGFNQKQNWEMKSNM